MPYSYTDPYGGAGPTTAFGTNTFFIDPVASTNGTGTPSSPFNSWANVPLGASYRYYQKRGTSWAGTFPSLTSGSASGRTVVGAYFNTDGSDDTSKAKPIINIGDAAFPGSLNSPKTFIRWLDVDIRSARQTATGDAPMMWLGSDVEIARCNVTTNLTAFYGEKCSNVRIDGNTIVCATLTGNVSQNAIVIAGAAAMNNNAVVSNNIKVGEGGTANSHVILIDAYSGNKQTNLVIKYNVIRTLTNAMTGLAARRGISCSNITGGEIAYNNVSLFVSGVFVSASINTWIHHNTLNYNGNFGVHVTGSTSGFLIEWNVCRHNGTDRADMSYYGRAIELSGGSQLNSCTRHIIRFNDASYSINYGGPADNGTEGVGIGLDDATSFCVVYGNMVNGNEGNGLQTYGGDNRPVDTGGHFICGNYFINNATMNVRNRRSGTAYMTEGAVQISLAGTVGTQSIVASNLFVGSFGGVRHGSNCNNIEISNNVFLDQTKYAICVPNLSVSTLARNIYKPNVQIKIGDLARDGNQVPSPASLSTGVATDRTVDPQLDSRYNPQVGSILFDTSLRSGVPWPSCPVAKSDV